MPTKRKPAQIIANTLAVLCPHCGEAQPDPENGSDMWTPDEVREASSSAAAKRDCTACDQPMIIFATTKALVQS